MANEEITKFIDRVYLPGDNGESEPYGIRANEVVPGGAIDSRVTDVENKKMDKENPTGTGKFAVGTGVIAKGENSHAEGLNTLAEGNNSHAEGFSTQAQSAYSHAEGYKTIAEGNDVSYTEIYDVSHAEGRGTQAKGSGSHSEGYNYIVNFDETTRYLIKPSSEEDNRKYTYARPVVKYKDSLDNNKEKLFVLIQDYPEGYPKGHEKILPTNSDYWSREVGTFLRGCHSEGIDTFAGYLTSSSNSYTGNGSHAEGIRTKARGKGSHVEGMFQEGNGEGMHVEGIGYGYGVTEVAHPIPYFSSEIRYKKNDIVQYKFLVLSCRKDFPEDYKDLSKIPEWNSTSNYKAYDLVKYNNSIYVCHSEPDKHQSPPNIYHWRYCGTDGTFIPYISDEYSSQNPHYRDGDYYRFNTYWIPINYVDGGHVEGHSNILLDNGGNGRHIEGYDNIDSGSVIGRHVQGRYNIDMQGKNIFFNDSPVTTGFATDIVGHGSSNTNRKNISVLTSNGILYTYGLNILANGTTFNPVLNSKGELSKWTCSGIDIKAFATGDSNANGESDLAALRITNPMYICAQNCFNVSTQNIEFQISNDGIYAQGFKDGGNEIELVGFNQIKLDNTVIHNVLTPENPDKNDAASVDYVDKKIAALKAELSK